MTRWATYALLVSVSLATPAARAQVDVGPPMTPLAPRPPAPPAPACDPSWREVARPPPEAPPVGGHWIITRSRVVWLAWGYAGVRRTDGTYAVADPASVPSIAIDARRRIVFDHALAHGRDVYVVGTRLTVLRFDGARWHLEHQDVSLGERRTHAPVLRACGGRLRAVAHGVAVERRDDGRWARVPRESLRACAPPPLDAARPAERCGAWTAGARIVTCAAGRRLWSVERARWLSLPDGLRVRTWAPVVEHAGGLALIDDSGAVQESDDGARWTTAPLPGPALQLSIDQGRLYAATAEALFAREPCAAP